jgi:thiol-disulfide isomerase/thioredoxin
MKNFLIVILFFLVTSLSFGQKLRFKVLGVPDTTVHLIKYVGKKLMYADTAVMKNGYVEFEGSKQFPGILGLLLPEQKFFEFIYNKEEVSLETNIKDFIHDMKVKKSEENKVFLAYVKYLDDQKVKANALVEKRKAFKEGTPEYTDLTDKIAGISKEVLAEQQRIITDNPTKLVAKIINLSLEIVIPEAPKGTDGKPLDTLFNYHYYFEHYFDNMDLTDDRLLNTPIFGNKFDTYFSKTMMVQHWDTIIKYAFQFVDKLDPKSRLFEYCVTEIILKYQKSKVMGMDKVYLYMVDKYYCKRNPDGKSPAYWMTESKLESLCEDMPGKLNTVLGVVAPNISLRDTTDVNWRDFHSLKAEYKILYFWEPTCGHCKKTTPKLQKLYEEKLKARNVEVFAVTKAMGEDWELWKKFIRENNLTFINVAVTESLFNAASKDPRPFVPKYTTFEALNYHITYDIMATPRVFVLDKDNKIIAKQLTIYQLEDFLDRMQNIENPVKLFQPDKEELESMTD